jgi:hypothetical protein
MFTVPGYQKITGMKRCDGKMKRISCSVRRHEPSTYVCVYNINDYLLFVKIYTPSIFLAMKMIRLRRTLFERASSYYLLKGVIDFLVTSFFIL